MGLVFRLVDWSETEDYVWLQHPSGLSVLGPHTLRSGSGRDVPDKVEWPEVRRVDLLLPKTTFQRFLEKSKFRKT